MRKKLLATAFLMLASYAGQCLSAPALEVGISIGLDFAPHGRQSQWTIGRFAANTDPRNCDGAASVAATPTRIPISVFRVPPTGLQSLSNAWASDSSGHSWVWWTVGAVVTVVALAAASSSNGQSHDGGTVTSVCGNNDVVLGNMCVTSIKH